MDRRDFVKTTGSLLAAASLPGASAFADAPISAGRSILPITRDWRFHPAKVDGAQSPYFND